MVYLYTGDQNDNFIWGTNEDDYLRGMGGNDLLSGGDGNDILEGGTGDDRLEGMYGNNTYLFGRGDGRDVIMSADGSISKHNTIRFGEGIAPDDILVERLGDSLVLRIAGTADSIVVDYYFQPGWGGQDAIKPFGIEEIRFFDGASWDRATVLTRLDPLLELDDGDNFFFGRNVDGKGGNDYLEGTWNDDVLRGGDGDDKLFGAGGDDILDGGAGNDLLDGGSGNNTFLFARGGGHDVISLNGMYGSPGVTVIDVASALPGTLSLTRSDNGQGSQLIISFKDSDDSITVDGFFDQNTSAAQGVRIQFADHSVWDAPRIEQAVWQNFGGLDLAGTDQADTLQGDWADDRLNGGAGDDVLYGNSGNDLLIGGDGVNTLYGGWGSDVLAGGNDFDTLIGEEGDDILDAGAGNAFLDAGAGNNIILFGRNAGLYQLWTRPDSTNTIVLGADVRPEDIAVSGRNSWEISIAIKGTSASITMPLLPDTQNVGNGVSQTYAQLKFADGTVWDNEILLRKMFTGDEDYNVFVGSERGDWMDGRGGNDFLDGQGGNDKLQGGNGDDTLNGGDGNDILLGQDGNDQLEGGMGDDLLNGGAGDDFMYAASGNNVFQVDLNGGIDTIMSWYNADSHNALQFGVGIAPEDVHVKIDASNGSLVVYINEGQEQVVTVLGYLTNTGWGDTMAGLSELRFANGTVWDNAAILREAYSGDAKDNWIDGSEGNDTIDGRGGNDVLSGHGGDDVLIGGSGDDWLDGGMGDNTFNGGAGNDLLIGMSGADTYIFNSGDGIDRLDEVNSEGSSGGQLNVIRFGTGINAADVRFEQTADTLIIHYGDGDAISVAHSYAGMSEYAMPVSRFEFADNSVFTYTQLANQAPELVWPLDDTFVQEGAELSISMAGRFIDRNMDELSYQLEVLEGGNMPAWLKFDPLTGNISGTPDYHDSGELMLKVTAFDKLGASASDEFKLKVYDFDPVPEQRQEIVNQDATEASPFSLAIPQATFVDPDGGALWYKMALANDAPLPSWLYFDSASMTLSGTPGDANTGSLQLVLTATDSAGQSVATSVLLNVANINQAPTLVLAPASQSVEDGVAFSYALPDNMFSDADAGDSGVLALDGLPAGFSFDAQTRTISGTASLAEVGAHALTVSFTDAGGLQASAGFALTVTAAASVSLTGSAGADTLTGKSNSDVLRGLGGDDILNGGIGADRMEGGSGNDTFYVDNTGDLVVENPAEGIDTVMASINYTLGASVERLTLTGDAINATGNTLNNTLTGNSGNNLIDGGLGDDSMAGGAGNDIYMVGSTSDTVTEAQGAGFDRVISSVGRSLGANQETLTLTGTAAINGNGNLLNNLVQGNSGNNSLSGGDGNDILQGGAGDDTLSDSSFALGNLFDGGPGADRLTGGAGADMFIGGAGNDIINTSSGADIIAFNRGSGMDAVVVANGNDNTVSLGHGILYGDLSLAKSGNDLILKTGMGEQIAFNGWYSSTNAHSVGTLQVVTEGGADYVVGSASAIHDNKIEQFNFNALVAQFDQVRVGQGSSFSWNVAPSLEAFSSGGSDSAAIGGDLAYQYAINDTLSALSAMPALAIIGSPAFGAGSHALQAGAVLNDGLAVLY